MLQELNPFPRTTGQWIGAITILIGWVTSLVLVWQKLVDKVDGLGGRVDELKTANDEKDGRMSRYENEMADMRRALAEGAKSIGRLESIVDGLDDHITGMELKIEGRLGDIRNLITDQVGNLRVQIAQMDTEKGR
jgi:chromosome segregation ATPase